ncbi:MULTISPECIES: hypothetical protein [unclassified Crossiella]|uniref:hypothetical protein n=1 Tax=unclassified Crossiella TaxID=2620835 RepID=UPI001FFEFBAA|nr:MULTISPECIES: hypothetical protein [unclassified Crossiella]MCK2244227.1 hypothetical protein [Crossiella sp. S99.2]MCK2258031.1 hypothetical protein [Crossiella sp. S99.1]
MTSQTIGNALVVHPQAALRNEIRDLALGLAADPDHQLVVVDLPGESPFSVWESTAKLLPRKRSGIRLVIGSRSRETTALAGQWLSERLNRVVIAPDGHIMPGVGGSLFVDAGWGSGWVRFQPGRPPKRDGKRFPRPAWEAPSSLAEIMPTSANGVAEPLPGGVWLRPRGPEHILGPQRARLIATVPCQPEICTVVIGCPGAAPVTVDDITRFWGWLPEDVRPRLRLARFGPVEGRGGVPYGQAVADALGEHVICYPGLPVGARIEPDIHLVRADGSLGWQASVGELGYAPTESWQEPSAPYPVSYRAPVFGVQEVGRAVYGYAPDALLEVVQSGLWLRPHYDTANAAAIRLAEADAERQLVLYDEGDPESAARMRQLAEDLFGSLDNAAQRLSCVAPASAILHRRAEIAGPAKGALGPGIAAAGFAEAATLIQPRLRLEPPAKPAVPRPEEPATLRLESAPEPGGGGFLREIAAPAVPAGLAPVRAATDASPDPAAERDSVRQPSPSVAPKRAAEAPAAVGSTPSEPVAAPTPPAPAVEWVSALQAAPVPEAAALVPKRGLDQEREWLRRALSREYAAVANSVGRVLSEHPGFQSALERSSGRVLTDAVAVRLYLSAAGDELDLPLRRALAGPHVPFARCAVSGLSRLPSHRGAAIFSATPTAREWELYRSRTLCTEWGFVNALTAPCARQQAEHQTDVLLWSMTSRRTKLLEPDGEPTADRVLFVPGTNFKVLDVTEPAEGSRGQIVLRELAAGEIDAEGRVDRNRAALDELALTSMRRCVEKWAAANGEQRMPESAARRFELLPGLVRTVRGEG